MSVNDVLVRHPLPRNSSARQSVSRVQRRAQRRRVLNEENDSVPCRQIFNTAHALICTHLAVATSAAMVRFFPSTTARLPPGAVVLDPEADTARRCATSSSQDVTAVSINVPMFAIAAILRLEGGGSGWDWSYLRESRVRAARERGGKPIDQGAMVCYRFTVNAGAGCEDDETGTRSSSLLSYISYGSARPGGSRMEEDRTGFADSASPTAHIDGRLVPRTVLAEIMVDTLGPCAFPPYAARWWC